MSVIEIKHNLKKLPPCFKHEGIKWDFYIKDEEKKAETVSFIFGLSLNEDWEAKYLDRSRLWIIREVK